jgi:hypothetical protein
VKTEENRLKLLGHDIRAHDRMKMRLWHTIFADKNRAKLMKCQDVLSRLAVDAGKSQQRQHTLYKDVARDYNDPTWIPMSHPIASFSSKLRTSIPLKMIGEELLPDTIKKQFVSVKGEYKKVLANYKRSGNGDGNLRTPTSTASMTSSSVGSDFSCDSRSSFTTSIHLQYFWALVDELQLSDTVCQSLSTISFASNDDGTVSKTSGTSILGREGKQKKKTTMEESTAPLVRQLTKLSNGIEKTSNDMVIVKLEGLLREDRETLLG